MILVGEVVYFQNLNDAQRSDSASPLMAAHAPTIGVSRSPLPGRALTLPRPNDRFMALLATCEVVDAASVG